MKGYFEYLIFKKVMGIRFKGNYDHIAISGGI